jgi:hypothetical protein
VSKLNKMDKINRDRAVLEQVATRFDLSFDDTKISLDQYLPIIEKMRMEGAVVLLKWDGERGVGDNGPYTVLITGAVLQGDFFRTDSHSLTEALIAGIAFYARKMWNILD